MRAYLQFDVLSIFPEIIDHAVKSGLLGKACQKGLLAVQAHNLRDYSDDKHHRVDDVPYGGGPGMVLQAAPVVSAVEAISRPQGKTRRVLLSPRGPLLTQQKAHDFAQFDQVLLICGRYEGIDERVTAYVDEELSIGDYVLSGGEFAALVLIDAVARLVPGVVGEAASLVEESHSQGWLEYPQYTRPQEFRGAAVPDILLSGNHGEIAKWRREQAEALTRQRRPDLLKKVLDKKRELC